MSNHKLNHFGITVGNLEKSINFYKTNFDFQEIEEKRADKPFFRIKKTEIKLGDYCIELVQPYAPEKIKETKIKKDLQYFLKKQGANHLAFITPDINSLYQKLKTNNVEFIERGEQYFFCIDYDNTLIEVKEVR